MSKIALTPNASGTGTLTIAAPNTNTDRTLTLPDASGNVVVNEGSGTFKINASGNVGIGTASPTLNTNGTVLHINDSGASRAAIAHFTTAASGSGAADGLIVGKWSDDTNYIFDYDSNPIVFGVNSGEAMRIDASGNVGFGTATPGTARINSASSSTTSGSFAYYGTNSVGTMLFQVRGDGAFSTGVGAASPYNLITGAAANVFVDSFGFLYRSTSSLKYKTDVQEATHGLAEVMALRPVTYKSSRADASGGVPDAVYGGLIAEEVHEAGLTEFVQYADDGTPDALSYGNMVSLCIKAIQEQQAQIEDLKAEIAALKGASA